MMPGFAVAILLALFAGGAAQAAINQSSAPAQPSLSATQAQQNTLVVGSEQDYPPFATGMTDATAGGFTVGLWKAVAAEAGLNYTIRVRPFHQILQEFKEGKIDVLINFAHSDERHGFADFTVPHVVVHGAIFVRKGESGISSEDDFAGKSIIVLNADLAHDYAVSKGWEKQLVLVDTSADGMRLLASGKHDAMLLGKLAGMQTLQGLGLTNIEALKAKAGFSQKFAFAVSKGQPELLYKLNEGLALTKSNGAYNALYDKWFGVYEEKEIGLRDFLKYLTPVVVVFLGIAGYFFYRRQVERAEAEKKYRDLYDHAPAMLLSCKNENANIIDCNQTLLDATGYSREELIGRSAFELYDPDCTSLARAAFQKFMVTKEVHGVELQLRCKDGSKIDVSLNATAVCDEHGVILHSRSALRDITERKAIQKQIADQLAFTEAVINAEVDALAVCQSIAVPPYISFTVWNPSMEALTGYCMEEINRLGWYQTVYVDPEVREQALQRMERMRQGDHLHGEEWVITRKDGERRIVQIHTVTVAEGDLGAHVLAVMDDITERKKAEQALHVSGKLYRSLFENMLNGFAYCQMIFEQDQPQDFIYLSVNDTFKKLTGLENVVGKRVSEVIPGIRQTDAGLFEIYGRVSLSGKSERFEVYVAALQQWFWISVYSPGKGYFVAVFDIITERKQAEKILREKTRLLDSIVENIPNTIFLKRASDLRYELFNRAGEALIGHKRDELLGRNDYDIFPKEQADFFVAKDRATLEQDGMVDIPEEPIETPRGTRILHTRKLVLRDEQGQPQYLLGISEDITDHKQAEAALRDSEQRFRTVFQNSADAILLHPLAGEAGGLGRFIEVNDAAIARYGYSRKELLAMTPVELDEARTYPTPEDLDAFQNNARQSGHLLFDRVHIAKDGRRIPVEVSSHIFELQGETMMLSIVRDITGRKEYEEELKRSNAELEQFSYAVSHDMRQPLRMISSYLQLLEKSLAGQLDGEKRGYFDFAIEGAKRIDQMLVALLEYSRIGRMGEPPIWIDSRAMLDEALQFLQPAIAEAQARVSITGDWPRILVSHDEILRLLQNLIGNATKYRIAGRIPEITVTSGVVKNEWHLCVADNGVGIIPDQIKRLFQVFQRLQSRDAYEGTGIGLALCRKIAEHHKGRIWAESMGEGKGSKFCVVLPVIREKA